MTQRLFAIFALALGVGCGKAETPTKSPTEPATYTEAMQLLELESAAVEKIERTIGEQASRLAVTQSRIPDLEVALKRTKNNGAPESAVNEAQANLENMQGTANAQAIELAKTRKELAAQQARVHRSQKFVDKFRDSMDH